MMLASEIDPPTRERRADALPLGSVGSDGTGGANRHAERIHYFCEDRYEVISVAGRPRF